MEITALILCALVFSATSHFYIQKLSRSALLELQMESSYSLQDKYPLYIYQLINLFRINTPLSCESCRSLHKIRDFFSFSALFQNCRKLKPVLLFCSEVFFFLLFLLYYQRYGFNIGLWVIISASLLFFMITVIDFKYFIIPDQLNYIGIFFGISINIILQLFGVEGWSLQKSLLGLFLCAGTLRAVAYLSSLLLRREAMGGGDIKLMAFIGALFGPKTALLALALSALIGSFFGLFAKFYAKYIQKKDGFTMIAYGPYIILATLFVLYFGENEIIRVYEHYSYRFVVYYLGL
jgi:leader peptidase (prepilin peptidase)/N-methyltransferase